MKISTSFFHLYLLLSCFIISPFSHFNSFTFPSETIFHLLRYIPLFLSFILFYFFFRGVSLFPTFCFIVEIRDQPLPSLFALFAADGIRKIKTTFRKSDKDNENIHEASFVHERVMWNGSCLGEWRKQGSRFSGTGALQNASQNPSTLIKMDIMTLSINVRH